MLRGLPTTNVDLNLNLTSENLQDGLAPGGAVCRDAPAAEGVADAAGFAAAGAAGAAAALRGWLGVRVVPAWRLEVRR